MDEKPFRLGIGQRRKRAVAVEGSDRTFKEQTNRESCTLIEAISAAGEYTNPTIIWKAKKAHRMGWYRGESDPKTANWLFGFSEKGYNNKQITLEWLCKLFDPETRWALRQVYSYSTLPEFSYI